MKKVLSIILSVVLSLGTLFAVGCGAPEKLYPQLRINETTLEWEASYDGGVTWEDLDVNGAPEKLTPTLRINEETNMWEASYDNGLTWTSLGIKADDSDEPVMPDFTPVHRFVVTGDVHLRNNGAYDSYTRLEKIISTAYGYSESQEDYDKLDGIFFTGDNTNEGSEAEQTYFFNYLEENVKEGTTARAVMGNHEFYATGYYDEASFAQAPVNFLQYSGYKELDTHLVIGGYHYLFLNMDSYSSGNYFTQTKIDWLKTELDKAVADDPTGSEPIFIFGHEPPSNTMIGSGNGDTKLHTLLKNYPQAVSFSGHTHRPISDPQAIWQGEYTALTTGSMAYLSMAFAGHLTSTNTVKQLDDDLSYAMGDIETGTRNGNMYYIVEIDEDNNVRILRYDAIENKLFGKPWILDSIGDPDGFDYTDDRKFETEKPEFKEGAKITVVSNNYKKAEITFPQAKENKDLVQNYRISFVVDGEVVRTEYALSGCFLSTMPETLRTSVAWLDPATEYEIKIYPVTSWGRVGEPIKTTMTTSQRVAGDNVAPDVLKAQFNLDGSATNLANNKPLTTVGAPTVAYDETLKMNVATFDGSDDAFKFEEMGDWYSTINQSFSMEAYYYVDGHPSGSYANLMSNQQSGGFGFEYRSGGNMEFIMNVSGNSPRTKVAALTKQWVHIVGTFDGQNIKYYVNGELMQTVACVGTLKLPAAGSHFLVIGGDSAANGGCSSFFKGKIAIANFYSDPLTEAQVQYLYEDIANPTGSNE